MSLTKRTFWLPEPRISLFLLLIWLLLNNTLAPGHVLLGAFLGWLIPFGTRRYWPETVRTLRPLLLARYALRVIGDIVIANFHVARLVLGDPDRLRPAMIEVPLDISDPFALTVLASTISLTPGTVSMRLVHDRRALLVHALDVGDEAALVAEIKQRYEHPLKEIFGC